MAEATRCSLGQYDSAIQDYDEATHLDPQDALAYSDRANACKGLGQLERALQEYDDIRLNLLLTLAYLNRGGAYVSLGRYERASKGPGRSHPPTPRSCPFTYANFSTMTLRPSRMLTEQWGWGLTVTR